MADVNLTPNRDATSAASSSTSPSHDHTNSYVYDVFLSHRGPDVKKTVATDIYRRLKHRGLAVFLDQQVLREGERLVPQIERAIRTASVNVAIFSPGYADSPWCLNELLLMTELESQSLSIILPVFYNVQPSDLRWTQSGDGVYARALSKLEEKRTFDVQTNEMKPRHDAASIQKWKKALSDVSNICGFELKRYNGDERQLVDEVVQRVLEKVRKPPLFVADYPSGLLDKLKDVEMKVSLQRQSGNLSIVGIVGCGGVGKTTLAKEFFNRERSNYSHSCFLFDIRSRFLPSLQSSLLKDLINSNLQINSVDEGKVELKRHLSSSPKVLIVLDDVDHIDQLEALLLPVEKTIHRESLILVTSRNKDVLKSSGMEMASIYMVQGLSPKHSQELFCWHAFSQPHPVAEFEEVVKKFLDACNGLPLSLKVLGALLYGEDDLEIWNEQLHKTSRILHTDIKSTLKISYDALDEEEKQIFLDVACFFIREDRDTAIRVWNGSGWAGRSGLQKLENRCLVEVDSENYLRMHDHIRDLGRDIAKNPEYPRRLWRLTDDLLDNVSEQSPVRGIMLHGNGPEQSFENHSGTCNLSRLQLLRAEGYFVKSVFSVWKLPKLIYLHWDNCPNSSLPFFPLKNLRVLYIKGPFLKTLWQHEYEAPLQLRELYICAPLSEVPESIGKLKHLEKIVLEKSYFETLPNKFCDLHSLKELILSSCEKMTLLPNSAENLTCLRSLKLTACSALKKLPDSVGNLVGLQSLQLEDCTSLERLPDSVGKLMGLQALNLEDTALQTLPDSVGNLTGLKSLDMNWCFDLQTLPDSIGKLTGLSKLGMLRCSALQTLPDSVGNLTGLQSVDMAGCSALQTLPDSVGNLTGLQRLNLGGCSTLQMMPDSVGNLTGLQSLDLTGCSILQTLPDSVGNLTSLQSLLLTRCPALHMIPDSVGNMRGLQRLVLGRCSYLQTLPDWVRNLTGLQSLTLELDGCSPMQTLQDWVGSLTRLQSLDLTRCSVLQTLPDSVGNLTDLQFLDLRYCSALQMLPDSVGTLTGLRSLHLSYCSSLQMLPDSVGKLTGLETLDMSWCSALQTLPDSIGKLTGLESLNMCKCSGLQTLPDSVGNLTRLECINLWDCVTLKMLPESVGNLMGLQKLILQGCFNLQMVPNVEHLTSLVNVGVWNCPNLQSGERRGFMEGSDEREMVENDKGEKGSGKKAMKSRWRKAMKSRWRKARSKIWRNLTFSTE